MALMMAKLYTALRAGGVPEKEAAEAAEEAAGLHTQLDDLLRDLTLLKWMMATMITLMAAIGGPSLWLLLRVAGKVGAL